MNKHVHTTIIITQHKGDIIWQNFFTWYDSEQTDEKPNCCLKRGHAVLKNCSPPGRPRSCWLCKKQSRSFSAGDAAFFNRRLDAVCAHDGSGGRVVHEGRDYYSSWTGFLRRLILE